jgi:hypothetical protein
MKTLGLIGGLTFQPPAPNDDAGWADIARRFGLHVGAAVDFALAG